LVDKSLVLTEQLAGRSRYRQLETVRQFGREKLDHAGETRELSAAHCAYFLTVTRSYDPERSRGVIIEQPRSLDTEHDNLRAALRWSCAEDPPSAILLVAGLWRFWFLRGHSVEGARWVERALVASPAPSPARARALIGLTGLDSRQGRNNRHLALGTQALDVALQTGDRQEVMRYRLLLATLTWSTTDLDGAERLARELRTDATDLGSPEVVAGTTWILGQCAMSREEGALATTHFEACLTELADADPAGAPFFPVVTPSTQLITVHGRVVPSVEETMLLGRRVGVQQAIGYVFSALGDAARLAGRPESAVALITRSIEHFSELGDDLARAQALNQLGCVQRDNGQAERAVQALRSARDLRQVLGDRRGELLTRINLALLRAVRGDIEGGLQDARGCLARFESVGDQVGIGAALCALGGIELASGEVRAAREMYQLAAARLAPWARIAAWQRLMVAELSQELDDRTRALDQQNSAAAVFDRMGCVVGRRRLAALNNTSAAC
jgi:tetratricopeptide (TPR) repeat protein